jgi:hypothetical protein
VGRQLGLITFTLLMTAVNPTVSGVEVFRLRRLSSSRYALVATALATWLCQRSQPPGDKPRQSSDVQRHTL